MDGSAGGSTRHGSAAGTANTTTPVSIATAAVACVSLAPATSAFQPAWSTAEARTSARAAALTRGDAPRASRDQLGESRRGHVPAGDRHADAEAFRLHPAGQQRGERAGPARLRDDLRAFEQQLHRGDDLLVGDGDDL